MEEKKYAKLAQAIDAFHASVNQKLIDEKSSNRANREANEIAEKKRLSEILIPSMMTLAKQFLLNGYLKVTSHKDNILQETKQIYLTKIEFYFHECVPDAIMKDYSMYHIPELSKQFTSDICVDYKKSNRIDRSDFYLNPFPIGSLHTHNSGIDLTFDDPDNRFRASILIRGYKVGGKNEERSTYIYDNVLMGNSIIDGNSVTIEWKDDPGCCSGTVHNTTRKNLKEKIIEKHQRKDTGIEDTREWQFYIQK